jgi:hypothetical protein
MQTRRVATGKVHMYLPTTGFNLNSRNVGNYSPLAGSLVSVPSCVLLLVPGKPFS